MLAKKRASKSAVAEDQSLIFCGRNAPSKYATRTGSVSNLWGKPAGQITSHNLCKGLKEQDRKVENCHALKQAVGTNANIFYVISNIREYFFKTNQSPQRQQKLWWRTCSPQNRC